MVVLPKTEALLAWKAPIRPFKRRSKEFFSTVGTIAFLVGVILLFLKEWSLIMVIIALLFLVYVLSTTPPKETEHAITDRGIVTGGKKYAWNELGNFWFSQQWGQKVLNIQSPFQFPGRLVLLLGNQKQEPVEKFLSRFLELVKPEPGMVEKAGDWLSKKVPLESPSS